MPATNVCSLLLKRRILPSSFLQSSPKCIFSTTTATARTTNITSNDDLNSGTISAVYIFHRHGDRTPNRPLCADHQIDAEAKFWRTKLPPSELVSSVSKRFPTQILSPPHEKEKTESQFCDTKKEPFGFLTFRGALQMQSTGRRLRKRYNRQNDIDFLQSWDVSVFSTKYLRTTLSAQFFLDGFLPPTPSLSEESPILPVSVRDRHNDNLNAFDKNPELMSTLVSHVISDPYFQRHDRTAAPLAARLANFLPGLMLTKQSSFGGPSGINWIHAADHFVCRDSHDVPLSIMEGGLLNGGTPMEEMEEAMRSMASQTVAHLAWRFRQWYRHPPLLGAIAAPPLRDVAKEMMQQRTNVRRYGEAKPLFRVYSCHDVTILALLYALKANIVKEGSRFWPPYASTLVLELVTGIQGDNNDDFKVRVFLNGKGVKEELMTVDDFSNLVNALVLVDEAMTGATDDASRDTLGVTV